MAQAVELALEEKRHLIVEAGTGTGKTLAYLVPVIRSGKRVIISTGTKNLQEQLFYKDVPFLEQALFAAGVSGGDKEIPGFARNDKANGGKLSVCYMKGRNNYLCRKKLYDLTDQPVLSGLNEIEQYRAMAAWEKTTQTGDRAELAERAVAQAGRAFRRLPGAEVQPVGALLHYRDAAQGDGKRHYHRESSFVFCRSCHQAAGRGRGRCGDFAGSGGGDFR
jgi:ATP-dependent DNA helicase DinG